MARIGFFVVCAEVNIKCVSFSSGYRQLSIKPAGIFLPPVGE